jgi:hypothetical protein
LLPYHHRHYYCLFLLILVPIFLKPLLATGMWNNNSKPKTLKEINLFKPISQQQQIDVFFSKPKSHSNLCTHTKSNDHKPLITRPIPPPTHTHSKTSNTKYTKDIENKEKVKKKHTHTQQSETPPHKKLQNTKTRLLFIS